MPTTIRRQELEGATVLVIEDPTIPMVRFALASRRGALHDPDGAAGLSTQLFELLMRGTEKRSRKSFNQDLEKMGSALSASVGQEASLLRGLCLKRKLDSTFGLVQEALLEPLFDSGEHQKLVEEIDEEICGNRDDDSTLAQIFLQKNLYGSHPLGRSSLGEMDDLRRIDISMLKRLHKELFSRDNLVFLFAGDIDLPKACAVVTPLVEALPSKGADPVLIQDPPTTNPPTITLVDKPDRSQVQMRLAQLLCDAHAPDVFELWLGLVAFGGMFTGPLCREVRDKRGWSYGASASFDRRRRTPAPMYFQTAPATADAIDCFELQWGLHRELASGHLEDRDIDQARQYLINQAPFLSATVADLMGPILRCELVGRPFTDVLDYPQKLEQTQNESVRQSLRAHLSPEPTVSILVATAANVYDSLAERFPNASIKVSDYQEGLDAPKGLE